MAFVLMSASCRSSRSSVLASHDGSRPIAVLLYSSVWDLGIQSTLRIVVYEDGRVILATWEKEGGRVVCKHRTFSLAVSELKAVRRQVHELAVLRSLHSSYKALEDHWMVMDASHARMYVRDGWREAAVSVYALECVLHKLAGGMKLRPYEKGGSPPQFMSLYHRLETLAETPSSIAQLWTPHQVEVRLRDDFKHLPEQPVPWPKDWPTPGSSHALAQGNHSWNVLLDGTELPELRRLLPYADNETAVLMDGKKWAACWRPMMPGESKWWKAITSSR